MFGAHVIQCTLLCNLAKQWPNHVSRQPKNCGVDDVFRIVLGVVKAVCQEKRLRSTATELLDTVAEFSLLFAPPQIVGCDTCAKMRLSGQRRTCGALNFIRLKW